MQRRYAIADIRGDFRLLNKLMDKIGPTESDTLIFLGSYLGPGGSSKSVIDYLLRLRTRVPNTMFLRGCYEWMFGFCIESEPSYSYQKLWGEMGGVEVFKSYVDDTRMFVANGKKEMAIEMPLKIPETHIRFMEHDLHQWYEDEIFPFVLTHCGGHPILFGGAMEKMEQTVFSENNWWLVKERRIPGKTVIFSHVMFEKPFRQDGKLGLDLGAGFGGKLAAFEMMSDSIVTVEN